MKKLFFNILIAVLCLSVVFSFTACTPSSSTPGVDASPSPAPTPLPDDIDPATVDVIGTVWMVTELSFESTEKYVTAKGEQGKLEFYGEFTHKESGKTLTIPGFWDGNDTFKLRFAPTLYGVWEYKTICQDDESLAGKTGTIGANAYKGDLELYKRGFVKTDPTKKYFIYDDGTPFFYIGDTHWSLGYESFDSPGDRAGNTGATSHFKYICDKRVEQGYTVYQSNNISGGKLNLVDCKINRDDIAGFQYADKYFQYIAEKGFTHAHAQFDTSAAYVFPFYEDKEGVEDLARYWVARYGAYPVMWTLAQEIDNDFYFDRGDQSHLKYNDNIYVYIAECINKYDAYNHPLSGHQEGASHTTAEGSASHNLSPNGNNGQSAFYSEEVTQKTGHDWWASQWSLDYTSPNWQFEIGKEYWETSKVSIMYEGRYCNLWTKNFGARAQGWYAYLNGFFGYGYGAQDIWLYNSTYHANVDSFDGYDTVTIADKKITWGEAIELESGYQVSYMKQFFEKLEWWKLIPDFDNNDYFVPALTTKCYTAATINGNDTYIVYIFDRSTGTGYLSNMDSNAAYTLHWYNPRTNEYTLIGNDIKSNTTSDKGTPAYQLPNKPDRSVEDWVILATKNK